MQQNRKTGPRKAIVGKRGERGFTALILTVSIFATVGMIGLAVDVGRMFLYKNELQTFVDASAMAAIAAMDGTSAGIVRADAVATAGPLGSTKPNGYNFDSTPIANTPASGNVAAVNMVTTGYATSFSGTYDSATTAEASATNHYMFMSVSATVSVPLNFLPVLQGIGPSISMTASAIAGQKASDTVPIYADLAPFAPDAHNQADKVNFGFTPGISYTLKWGNSGGNDYTNCPGDMGMGPNFPPGSPPSEHGFVDIGEGNSNANVQTAITYGGWPNANSTPSSVSTGNIEQGVPGNRGTSIDTGLNNRVALDTDPNSLTYAAYEALGQGNGRRIITVMVAGTWAGTGSNVDTPVLGFANFFLQPSYSGSSGPLCATYIGPGTINGSSSGATDSTKIYTNVLFQ
jgi:hypothetical protein